MKQLLGMLTVLFFCNAIQAQNTLYTINFGTTGTALPTGWTKTGAASANLVVSSTNPSTNGYTGASGSLNVGDAGTVAGVAELKYENTGTPINTNGFGTVDVRFGAYKSGYTGTVDLQWSANGTTWTTLVTNISLATNAKWYQYGPVALPAGALNQANIRFKFIFTRPTGTTAALVFRIDDFLVTGTTGATGGGGGGTGTVTSVGLTMPSGFTVSGSPVTTSGTLAASTTLNGLLRGNGSGFTTGAVNLANTDVTGTLPIANGGIGATTATAGLNNLLPSQTGNANKVLQTDGANVSWQTPAGGGSSQWTTSGSDIYYNTGNVGIGITAPAQKLDVNGNIRINKSITNAVNSNAINFQYDANNGIGFQLTDGNAIQMAAVAGNNYIQAIGGTSPFHIGTWPAKPIKLEVGATRAMTIHANGRISIGADADNALGQLQITGNTWHSGFGQYANATFGAPNVKIGYDGTNPEAIAISGAGLGTPALKLTNMVYALDNGKGVIDIDADHTYMYGLNGSGSALKYKVSAFNPSSNAHWGVYMDMQDAGAGSLAPITTYYTKVKTVNGNNYGFYADATIHAGGTGTAYAFYGAAGKNYFAGNTGIGTVNPSANLDVTGTFKLADGTQGAGKILTSDANGNASWQTAAGGGGGYWTDAGSGNLYNTTQTGSISIGINTFPAGYKLAVAGKIIAEKVTAKLVPNWPDFVFRADYKLLSLNEIEQYIQQHKHLPDVPSADEVGKNGIDLGDNQALLLKKIEELTLHMIEMNRKIENLQTENETLKNTGSSKNK